MLGETATYRRAADDRAACQATADPASPGREQGDVTPLVQTVKRWWFEADAWRDPQAQREFLARIDTHRDEGPPPAEQRMSREEIRTQFGV